MATRNFNRQTTALQVLEGIDLSGKTVLITGANNGIGLETARGLAYHNAHVIMACRNLTSAEEAKTSIIQGHPNAKIDIIYFDSSKLSTVESCAAEYIAKGWPLNILVLNAGVYNPPEKLTGDGFESTFQINHLAHFYLVKLLEPVLLKSTPVRVISVSSEAHRVGTLNPEKITRAVLSPPNAGDVPKAFTTYGRSKFCNVLFANELQRRFQQKGVSITSNSLHPGVVKTQIGRTSGLVRFIQRLPWVGTEAVITMDKGAATTVYCATASEEEGVGGKYYHICKVHNVDRKALNEIAAKNLWDLSDQMLNEWKSKQVVPSKS